MKNIPIRGVVTVLVYLCVLASCGTTTIIAIRANQKFADVYRMLEMNIQDIQATIDRATALREEVQEQLRSIHRIEAIVERLASVEGINPIPLGTRPSAYRQMAR